MNEQNRRLKQRLLACERHYLQSVFNRFCLSGSIGLDKLYAHFLVVDRGPGYGPGLHPGPDNDLGPGPSSGYDPGPGPCRGCGFDPGSNLSWSC